MQPVFFARTYCSICQANHEWFAREHGLRTERDYGDEVLSMIRTRGPRQRKVQTINVERDSD